jgi:hypothetical protein
MVPVQKRKRIGRLRQLWLRFAPEFWRGHLRLKAHREFLMKLGITDRDYIKHFASEEHLLDEMTRIKGLPPRESVDFDCRKRSQLERRELLYSQLKAAFDEFRSKAS